ncbi:hypothetical protein GCM10011419_20120 [Vogesella fluminis]|uniref:Amino acid permease n=1 Tax=Vogesella fluminis TaxID=1069161 RepID=A0ABQ3HDM9_9NEIS|nr:hypothetical protein GCM10011419_20120 [Vogesella fluminis]
MIWSLAICLLLYVIMTGIVPYAQFAGIDHPVSLALQVAKLDWFAGFVDLGAILGMMTVILVMTYGQTRILLAMSRDGLLPKVFSDINPKYGTPYKAMWLIGTVIALIAGCVPLHTLAVIVLRKREADLPRKFYCPAVPYVPALAILFCVFLMTQLSALTWALFVGWLLIGLGVYFGYSRRNSLLHKPR